MCTCLLDRMLYLLTYNCIGSIATGSIFSIFLHHCCFCVRVHYCFGGNSPTSPTFRYQVLVVSTTFIGPCLVDAFCRCRRAGHAGPTICTLAAGPSCRKQDAARRPTRTSTSRGSDLDLYFVTSLILVYLMLLFFFMFFGIAFQTGKWGMGFPTTSVSISNIAT